MRFFSVQHDFKKQKCEIKKLITNAANRKHQIVMYDLKYHCKINHIEHFWCSTKKWE